MNDEKIIIPTKEEVKKLLMTTMNDKILQKQTIGELLGMKLIHYCLKSKMNLNGDMKD